MLREMATAKLSVKERQRQLREDMILDTAEEILASRGLAGLTLDDLIVEVGISKPTLYQHFRSKEELIGAIMTRRLREGQRLLAEYEHTLKPGEALRKMVDWFIELRAKDACPVTSLCITLSLIAQEPIREAERNFAQALERLVASAQGEGAVRKDIPAIFVSQTLFSIAKDWSYHDLFMEGRADVDSLKKSIYRMLLGEEK